MPNRPGLACHWVATMLRTDFGVSLFLSVWPARLGLRSEIYEWEKSIAPQSRTTGTGSWLFFSTEEIAGAGGKSTIYGPDSVPSSRRGLSSKKARFIWHQLI